jgi:hypothetical protein
MGDFLGLSKKKTRVNRKGMYSLSQLVNLLSIPKLWVRAGKKAHERVRRTVNMRFEILRWILKPTQAVAFRMGRLSVHNHHRHALVLISVLIRPESKLPHYCFLFAVERKISWNFEDYRWLSVTDFWNRKQTGRRILKSFFGH